MDNFESDFGEPNDCPGFARPGEISTPMALIELKSLSTRSYDDIVQGLGSTDDLPERWLAEEVLHDIRSYYVERLEQSDSPILNDLQLAAGLISARTAPGEVFNQHHLDQAGEDFYFGAALAYEQLSAQLTRQGFNFAIHEGTLKCFAHTLLSALWPLPLRDAVAVADTVKKLGLGAYQEFDGYWQPLLTDWSRLFSADGADFSSSQAGIGYATHLIQSSLGGIIDKHNEFVTKQHHDLLVTKFRAELDTDPTLHSSRVLDNDVSFGFFELDLSHPEELITNLTQLFEASADIFLDRATFSSSDEGAQAFDGFQVAWQDKISELLADLNLRGRQLAVNQDGRQLYVGRINSVWVDWLYATKDDDNPRLLPFIVFAQDADRPDGMVCRVPVSEDYTLELLPEDRHLQQN